MSDFGDTISWYLLPKTFQDAIVFTRQLNIRYLWIDSLCIIQDSKEDWELESAKIAAIYERITVTLSAAAAKNGSMGCFVQPSKLATGFVTDGKFPTSLTDSTATAKFLADETVKIKVLVREVVNHTAPSGGA